MKRLPLIAFAVIALLAAWGCVDQTGSGTASGTSDTVPGSVDTLAELPMEAECGSLQPGQFCSQGLDMLQLGESLAWNDTIRSMLPDGILKDTILTEVAKGDHGTDTVSWFCKILRLPDGMVYLDADFEEGYTLGRVRIESGRYHHVSGLRVGSTGRELKSQFKDAYVIPFQEYGVMEVIVPYRRTRMIFHFPQHGIFQSGKQEYRLSDIPDDAQVVRIVLM
ncbi:MAG: hypothetical protein RLZZ165_2405 [Bacteroidota bacterium]|jgi:hypothetical protein